MKYQKYNFTKRLIDELGIPKQRTYYCDSQVRGLYLEISPRGTRSFYVRRMSRGRSDKLFIGRFPDVSIEQARSKAMSFHADLSIGHSQAEEKRSSNSELSLSELFELYLERHMQKSRKTGTASKQCFYNWFSRWKDWKISSISRESLEVLHAQLANERGKYTANRALQLISAMYNKAILWKIWKGDNPARGITKFSEFARERVLREDEIGSFFSCLNDEPRDQFYDFVMLLILTGQRKSNVLAMRWQDVDLTANTWTIPAELMKNGQTMMVALTQKEIDILKLRAEFKTNDFVFPSEGKLGHYIEPKRRWKNLLSRAKISDFHIHDLRRTLASYMANSGANVALIQSALNHKDLRTTLKVYAKVGRRAELEARSKAHELMFSSFTNVQVAASSETQQT
jgi:integrase